MLLHAVSSNIPKLATGAAVALMPFQPLLVTSANIAVLEVGAAAPTYVPLRLSVTRVGRQHH